MQLVNEQDDLAVGIFNLLEHSFEAVFKLTTVFRSGQHRTKVERHHTLVFEELRHIAGDDALGQTFYDRCLTDSRLADQYRIVLGPARKHLHYAADLFVTADHGLKLAAARQLRQVFGIALQRLVFAFRILVGHALRPADSSQRFENGVVLHAGSSEDLAGFVGFVFVLRHGQQEVLGRDIFVLEFVGFFECLVEDALHGVGELWLRASARDFGQAIDALHGLRLHTGRIRTQLREHCVHDPFAVLQQRCQQVDRQQFRIAVLRGDFTRLLNRFL